MNDITLRPIDLASPADLAALQSAAFADFEPSKHLAEVLAAEAAARPAERQLEVQDSFGLVAFRGDVLVGWSQGYREGKNQFYMLNSGVAASERRKGVYLHLVNAILEHTRAQGYSTVRSRHTATNTAVIIAKLRLGFQVSGFEYSEVYGPLVQLTYLVSQARRDFYQTRTRPLRASVR